MDILQTNPFHYTYIYITTKRSPFQYTYIYKTTKRSLFQYTYIGCPKTNEPCLVHNISKNICHKTLIFDMLNIEISKNVLSKFCVCVVNIFNISRVQSWDWEKRHIMKTITSQKQILCGMSNCHYQRSKFFLPAVDGFEYLLKG
jgi:hypothetical protein